MATQTKTQMQYFYKGKEVSKKQLINIFIRHLKEENLFYSDCVNMDKDNYKHFKTFIKNSNPCHWTNILSRHLRIKFKNVWFPLVTTSEIKQVIDKFFNFLDEHNCREEYLHNLDNHSYNESVQQLSDSMSKLKELIINYQDGYDLINASYCWADTEQGHDFWWKLDDEWNEIVSNQHEREERNVEIDDDFDFVL